MWYRLHNITAPAPPFARPPSARKYNRWLHVRQKVQPQHLLRVLHVWCSTLTQVSNRGLLRAAPAPQLQLLASRTTGPRQVHAWGTGIIRGSVTAKGAGFGLHRQPSAFPAGRERSAQQCHPPSAQALAQGSLDHGLISTSSLQRVLPLLRSNWSLSACFLDSPPVQTLRYSPHTNPDISK